MTDWFLHTGLYLIGIALIQVVGLLLICWGPWRDRCGSLRASATSSLA